jgi:ribosome-binding factor A
MAKLKEPSQRQLRVGEEIRHILADVFTRQDFSIKDLSETLISVTVTEVDISPDLRNATAYVSPLGDTVNEEKLIKALNENAGQFNHAIAKKLAMKFAPKLKFSSDTRFDYAARIEELLDKAKKQ